MKARSKLLITSFSVLALGAGLSLARYIQEQKNASKSLATYWEDTGLNDQELVDLIGLDKCMSSERYYLSCVNAIVSVATRYNMNVLPTKGLVDLAGSKNIDSTSEKSLLDPWKNYFRNQTDAALKVDFSKLWQELKSNHIPSHQLSQMVGVGLNGFVSIFKDPHTYFMPVAQFQEVVAKADSKSVSLGISLGVQNQKVVIRKVAPKSSAAKSGIEKGDVILSINDQSVEGLMLTRVTEMLKGEEGDKVSLELVSVIGVSKEVTLTREPVQTATVSMQVLDGEKPVGVIEINKFARGTCDKVKAALEIYNKTNIDGVILDLRDNPGGQMEEAACVSSLFVGADKKVFEVRYLDPTKKGEAYYGVEDKIYEGPLAIIINSASASAAEIVAGALSDFGRAVLVGERSFGKGSFQEGDYWDINNKIAMFETKGFYYLPSGRSPQLVGLEPDVKVSLGEIPILRESEQYLHPLKAPVLKKKTTLKLGLQQGCTTEQVADDMDAQVNVAKQILLCKKTVARVL